MSRDHLIGLRHKGKTYVPNSYRYGQSVIGNYGESLFINGVRAKSLPHAVGDSDYSVVDGDIESVERRFSPKRIVVSYEARGEFLDAVRTPITLEEYAALNEERRDILYAPVVREEPQDPQTFPFTVVDVDASPRTFPENVTVTVPDYLRTFKSIWHTLPCQMTPQGIFKRLLPLVREAVKDKRHFQLETHESIETFTLRCVIRVKGFDYDLKFDVLKFCKDGRFGQQTPAVQGKNLDDLMMNVEAWMATQLAKIEAIHTPKLCPCCGHKLPKGSDVILPGKGR